MTLLARPTRDNGTAQFSYDGDRICTVGLYVSGWQSSTLQRLFRSAASAPRFALEPEGTRLLTLDREGRCSLLEGDNGQVVTSLPRTSATSPTAIGLSQCGRLALLADQQRLVVQDLFSSEVMWHRDGSHDQLIPIRGGREWALVKSTNDRKARMQIEVWRWPFGTAPENTLELPSIGYYPAIQQDRLALDDGGTLRVLSLGDGRELFNVVTGTRAQSSWLHDGSLAVVYKPSLDKFEWHVDLYDASGLLAGRVVSQSMITNIAASPVSGDVLLSYLDGIVVIPRFDEYIREHSTTDWPIAPREANEEAYAFDTATYPEEQEECAEVEAETVDEIVTALAPHQRSAWTPVTAVGRGPIVGPKFGGVPWLSTDETWPRCGRCGGLMDLVLQLNDESLPRDAPQLFNGLLQVFLCSYESPVSGPCQNLAPFSNAALVRVCQPHGSPAYEDLADDDLFDEVRIVGWKPRFDIPDAIELRTLGVALSDEQDELLTQASQPHDGDKLLGWPAWQQSVVYHLCPHCSQTMRPIFQIDSQRHIPVPLGDGGRGWVLQCPDHTEMVAFAWTF